MKQFLLTLSPPPPTVTSLGAQWGHPGNCQEQLLFFTYECIYTQYNLPVLLLDQKKKFT